MKEKGIVILTENEKAVVSVRRKSSCGDNCAMCKSTCKAGEIKATVENKIGAKKGDEVYVETDSKRVILGAFLLYILPVLLMFFVYILAVEFLKNKKTAALLSTLTLVLSGILIKIFDKKIAPKSYISEIIEKEV